MAFVIGGAKIVEMQAAIVCAGGGFAGSITPGPACAKTSYLLHSARDVTCSDKYASFAFYR